MKSYDLDTELRNFAVHSQGRCHESLAAGDAARARKADDASGHHGAPAHIRAQIDHEHDRVIDGHDRAAMSHARRATWAREGYLIDGPDERNDAEHARQHGPLIRAAHAAGRVEHFREYPSQEDDEPEEEEEEECACHDE